MTIRKVLMVAVLGCFAQTQASAEQPGAPRLLGCYKQVTVPAQYKVSKTLIKAAEQKYVRRNSRIELLEYPAVYREDRELIKESYQLMKEIPCS